MINPSPGPGAYQTIANISKNEVQLISKFERTKSPKIKKRNIEYPTKLDRVQYIRDRPGPGYYNTSQADM